MRTCGFVLLILSLAPAGFGQSEPAFEVATVKPSGDASREFGIGLFTYPGGRIKANMCPLIYLIQEAFELQQFQIAGAPRWVLDEIFDIEAKPPASSKAAASNPRTPKLPPSPEQRAMLRTLLAERFHLRYRMETKEGPVYFLLDGKKGLKLEPAKNQEEFPWVGSVSGGAINGDGLAGMNAPMSLLAARLSRNLGRPVLDRTGLTGSFDFRVKYGQAEGERVDVLSAISTSLRDLGLKLESAKGPVETLVIEHAERPAGN